MIPNHVVRYFSKEQLIVLTNNLLAGIHKKHILKEIYSNVRLFYNCHITIGIIR